MRYGMIVHILFLLFYWWFVGTGKIPRIKNEKEIDK
jgi:hypothetical protein